MAEYFVKASGGSDSNDGLDPLGLALTTAAYDHTGNGEGERHLSQTDAFIGYSFTAGDQIYLNGTGGVADGLYEIASKVDNDAILLVADAGLTGDSTSPSITSSDGPWATIQKGFDTATAGDIVNICADGTHSPTATIDVDTNSGAENNPIRIRGATANGVFDGTTRPTIDGSGLPASPATHLITVAADDARDYYWLACLVIQNASGDGISNLSQNNDYWSYYNIRATGNGGAGINHRGGFAIFDKCEGDNNADWGLGTDTNARGDYNKFYNNRAHDNGGAGIYNRGAACSYVHNICYDNTGHNFWVSSSGGMIFLNNVAHGSADVGLKLNALATGPAVIRNNVFAGNGSYGVDGHGEEIAEELIDYNIYYNNTTAHRNNGFPDNFSGSLDDVDPQFESIVDGSEDFTPASGSNLLDAGQPIISA